MATLNQVGHAATTTATLGCNGCNAGLLALGQDNASPRYRYGKKNVDGRLPLPIRFTHAVAGRQKRKAPGDMKTTITLDKLYGVSSRIVVSVPRAAATARLGAVLVSVV